MSTQHNIRLVDGVLVVDGTGDAVELWSALRAFFLERRPSASGRYGIRYPQTSTLEVLEVCTLFDRELSRAPGDAIGLDTELVRWVRTTRRAELLARGHRIDDTFRDNETFWLRDTKRLALYLAVARDLPTRTQMIKRIAERARSSS